MKKSETAEKDPSIARPRSWNGRRAGNALGRNNWDVSMCPNWHNRSDGTTGRVWEYPQVHSNRGMCQMAENVL